MPDRLRRTSPEMTQRAKSMRKEKTPAEALLWEHLRAKRLRGSKWRQQYPIGGYIPDFYCPESRLVIELDGAQHNEPDAEAYDAIRTRAFGTTGIRVIRFSNAEVMNDTDRVLKAIASQIRS